jgi:DNA-binding response OmpR family regulator
MSTAAYTQTFIIVIDDSPVVRKLLQVMLSRQGYTGASFADGMTAIQWLRQPTSPVPDLVFLDLCLPHMNGYQVARSLRSIPQCKYTRIIMLTKLNRMFDRWQAWQAGVDSYMTKPFTTEDILSTVQQQLSARTRHRAVVKPYHFTHNEQPNN